MTKASFPDLPVCTISEPGHVACVNTFNIVPPPPQPAALIEAKLPAYRDTYCYTEHAILLTQEYVSSHHAELAMISQRWEEERRGEERWYDNWRTAVQKVKELFA